MAGNVRRVWNVDPGELERLVAGERVLGAATGGCACRGSTASGFASDRRLGLGDVDRRAGRLGEVGDAPMWS